MSDRTGWSIKGIHTRARDAAREAARQEGLTLGEYLNRLLTDESGSIRAREMNEVGHGKAMPPPPSMDDDPVDALDRLAQRVEAVEARSTLAISGIDQSVVGLLKRLEQADQANSELGDHLDSLMDEVRETHGALTSAIQRLEADDSSKRNLDGLRALEGALSKLADHVYAEAAAAQNETDAIKGRVEAGFTDLSEKVEGMEAQVASRLKASDETVKASILAAEQRSEGAARHLADRFTGLEQSVMERLTKAETAIVETDALRARVAKLEDGMGSAIGSLEATLTDIKSRLTSAENGTNAAMAQLEERLGTLDTRIETVARRTVGQEGRAFRAEFDARFEGLAKDLRSTIDRTRTELAGKIEDAAASANPEIFDTIKADVDSVRVSMSEVSARQDRALSVLTDRLDTSTQASGERLAKLELAAEQAHRAAEKAGAATETNGEHLARLEIATDGALMAAEKAESAAEAAMDRANAAERLASNPVEDAAAGADTALLEEKFDAFTDAIEQRLAYVETGIGGMGDANVVAVDEKVETLSKAIVTRLDGLEARETETVSRIGEELARLTETVDTRVADSERNTATAIEQLGKTVANVTHRMEARQSDALTAMDEKLAKAQSAQDQRMRDALNRVSAKLDEMQSVAQDNVSPVQRAIASLAARLEALESFNAPPFTDKAVEQEAFGGGTPAPFVETPAAEKAEPAEFTPVYTGYDEAPLGSIDEGAVPAQATVAPATPTTSAPLADLQGFDHVAEASDGGDADADVAAGVGGEHEAQAVDGASNEADAPDAFEALAAPAASPFAADADDDDLFTGGDEAGSEETGSEETGAGSESEGDTALFEDPSDAAGSEARSADADKAVDASPAMAAIRALMEQAERDRSAGNDFDPSTDIPGEERAEVVSAEGAADGVFDPLAGYDEAEPAAGFDAPDVDTGEAEAGKRESDRFALHDQADDAVETSDDAAFDAFSNEPRGGEFGREGDDGSLPVGDYAEDFAPPGEFGDRLPEAASAEAETSRFDPLEALENWDDTLGSDGPAGTAGAETGTDPFAADDPLFDYAPGADGVSDTPYETRSETAADTLARGSIPDELPRPSLSDTPADTAEDAFAPDQTQDYLKRARQAALDAAEESNAPRSGAKVGGKAPVIAAATVAVLAAAGTAGYLYLRGKQAPSPTVLSDATPMTPTVPGSSTGAGNGLGSAATDSGSAASMAALIAPADDAPADTAETDAATEAELFDPVPGMGATAPEEAPQDAGAVADEAVSGLAYRPIPDGRSLLAAVQAGDPVAEFVHGQDLIADGAYAEGVRLVTAAARDGLAAAQYQLAKLHEKGLGVARDIEAARVWTERAANGGNVKAMHDLAVFYAEGEGGQQSYAKAAEWFGQAAAFGVVDSQYNLAVLYERGLGVTANLDEAAFWFAAAEAQGDSGAGARLATLRDKMDGGALAAATDRAESWRADTPDARANGEFRDRSWGFGAPNQVRAVQRALTTLGYDGVTDTGDVDAATAAAIRAYEADNGLAESGRLTPDLIRTLNDGAAAS